MRNATDATIATINDFLKGRILNFFSDTYAVMAVTTKIIMTFDITIRLLSPKIFDSIIVDLNIT